MPEWSSQPRHRRDADAPRIDLETWVKVITRRVEQHLKRDWLLGFTMSSVLFRSLLNQCRTAYSYSKVRRADGSRGFSAEELEQGAISICQALSGKYKDLDGKIKKVNGDFTKLKYAVNLNEAGKRLMQNIEHTSRLLKGTMEVRKLMRFDTNAGRVRRGVPIFVTFSPDEKHNVLMLRLHRSRNNDPIHKLDSKNKKFGRRDLPALDKDYLEAALPFEDLSAILPNYDERRALLSRDGLASVDGFRITILLVLEYICGLRVCSQCPNCNFKSYDNEENRILFCCQDLLGNNSYSDGGAFGRNPGIYISIEAQKSQGSLHAHAQLHVECLHQHAPLMEVMTKIKGNGPNIVAQYLRYKKHVCREEYADLDRWKRDDGKRRLEIETAWPEYKDSLHLVSKRTYLDSDVDGRQWLSQYLRDHVQVKCHFMGAFSNPTLGVFYPLTSCSVHNGSIVGRLVGRW